MSGTESAGGTKASSSALDVADLNWLRRSLEAVWWKGEPPAQLHLVPEGDYPRDAVLNAFRIVAREMGLKHVLLDLSDGLSADHVSRLTGPAPRMVVMLNLDRMPPVPDDRLSEAVLSGPPTLPIIVVFGPQDEIDVVRAGWPDVRAARAAGRDPGAVTLVLEGDPSRLDAPDGQEA